MNVRPAIVIVPLRAAPAFAAALNATVPLPLPDAAPVTVNHEAFDTAVQSHDAPVVTVTATLPVVTSAAMFWLVGEIEKLHAAASCDTVNVLPAIVNVPLRAAPVLALTV